MMGFSTIVLVTMVMLCGMLRKSNNNSEPGNHKTPNKSNLNKTNDFDIRVIYNPKSGTLELGSKASDPDDKMSDPDAILGGIINQNFIETRLNDTKSGHAVIRNGTNSSVCKMSTVSNTNTGPSSQSPGDGHFQNTDCSVAHAHDNPAFE